MEDGRTAEVGTKAYNYYDRYPVVIDSIDHDGWADCSEVGGTRTAMLDGQRLCSVETAKNKGWVA